MPLHEGDIQSHSALRRCSLHFPSHRIRDARLHFVTVRGRGEAAEVEDEAARFQPLFHSSLSLSSTTAQAKESSCRWERERERRAAWPELKLAQIRRRLQRLSSPLLSLYLGGSSFLPPSFFLQGVDLPSIKAGKVECSPHNRPRSQRKTPSETPQRPLKYIV